MPDLAKVLGMAQKLGAEYADVRYVSTTQEPVSVESDGTSNVSVSRSTGIGLRVLVDGAWGFASTPYIDSRSLSKLSEEAVRIAGASAMYKKGEGVALAPLPSIRAKWQTPTEVEPFSVKPEDKPVSYTHLDVYKRQGFHSLKVYAYVC